ncbi:MAG: signal peptidase II [Flavobacteriales bacterium]|nr:signal peptidase II [Flavobacteriales bacterium]
MRTALITIISVIFIDQFVKIWIKTHALLHEVVGSFGFIKFHFIENPGMAFGMAFGGDWGKIVLGVFRVLAIVGLGLIIRNLIENKAHKGLVLSISLIFAGALGNIIDGVLYGYLFDKGTVWDPMLQDWSGYAGVAQANFQGYAGILQGCVVDMIHAEFYYPSWMPFGLAGEEVFPPVFNIADSAISIGIVVIILFNKRFLGENASDFEIFKRKKKSLVE